MEANICAIELAVMYWLGPQKQKQWTGLTVLSNAIRQEKMAFVLKKEKPLFLSSIVVYISQNIMYKNDSEIIQNKITKYHYQKLFYFYLIVLSHYKLKLIEYLLLQ
jgi:hypothetical protein